ncbi:hypothetical protein JAAARDRAFT_158429 [Jaapia argillacea MUCL 33604]|uniref:Fungal-type protein kinase domain-containing protein n=1 Tax=Jaapia argillacea MUCL 33604 TaxID=933084 RepID=A0A067Q195_9AGAM|nr:hypothetical protein JAAARDRAFT_158429 [Jaapia argillacea MUCL 33604]
MLRNTEGIILVTEGTNIVDSLGPAQLYTAVFHALLGHWNLFQGGLLHRNVSIGNVMIMPKEQSSTIMDFDETKPLTLCQGMFIDFDQTILWTCWKRKAALRRSGTLPFVSIRLLTQWVFKNHSTPLHNIHTAIDDLESFIWVLIWAVAECIKINKLEFSDDESRYIDDLCQEDVRSLVSRKKGIRYDYSTGPKRHPSKGFAPFGSLLHELLGAARSASEALDDLLIALSASSNSDSQQTVDTSEADQDYNPCVSPDGRCNHSLPQEFTALMEKTYQQFVATFAKNQEPLKHTKWE